MSNSDSCCGHRASSTGRSSSAPSASECFLTDYQGRDLVTEVALAIDRPGRFLAMRAPISAMSARAACRCRRFSKGSGLITGNYDIPARRRCTRGRSITNTMCTQAYRSSGRPEVTFAIERLIDKAARECGFDRFELRRKNLIAPEADAVHEPDGLDLRQRRV